MRIQVLHDHAGNIFSIFAPAEGNTREGGIESPTPDRTVTELDAPDTTLPPGADQSNRIAATLTHLMEHYEVRSGRLVERSVKSTKNP